jgi:hypothetical protein
MRHRIKILTGLLGGLLLVLTAVATAVGYAGEVTATIEVSGPAGLQACNTPITLTARAEDIDGDPIEGQPVEWSFVSGNVSGDTILDTMTVTNSSGIATTQVRFACSVRSVTIQALADDASGTVVIALSGKGLPGTDTAPGSSLPAMALAAFAVLIGSGTILRRFAADRR